MGHSREMLQYQEKKLDFPTQEYVQKRMYYLFPFVRRMYMYFHDHEDFHHKSAAVEAFQTFETQLCELLAYYAELLLKNREPAWLQEDNQVEKLMESAASALQVKTQEPYQELCHILLRGQENTFNKSDGYYDVYQFGSTSAQTFWETPFIDAQTGKEETYSMQASGGLLELSGTTRLKLLAELMTVLDQERNNRPIMIWGNITRGIFDAALIHSSAQQAGVPAILRLYRYSSHAYPDAACVTASPPPSSSSDYWHIAVDSMTAGGQSVTGTKKMLETLGGRASMFLTFLGYTYWRDTFPVLFCFRTNADLGTLIDFC